MTDALPGLFLLTVLAARSLAEEGPPAARRLAVAALVVLGVVSAWIHVRQGLFEPATRAWNARPNVNHRPEMVLDWEYPQFLHSAERQERRLLDYTLRERAARPLAPGLIYRLGVSRGLVGRGWRRNDGHAVVGERRAVLAFLAPELLGQRVALRLGVPRGCAGELRLDGGPVASLPSPFRGWHPVPATLRPGRLHVLSFTLDDPRCGPAARGVRLYGVRLGSDLRVY